jgi:hypothetical protein
MSDPDQLPAYIELTGSPKSNKSIMKYTSAKTYIIIIT